MKILSKLYSKVQSQIHDTAFEKVQRAEYVDYAQRVIEDIASETKVWIASTTLTPNPSATPVDPAPSLVTLPANLSVRKIYHVTRNGVECREFSRQTVNNVSRGYYGFTINRTELDELAFTTQARSDESIDIQFGQDFQADETVMVEYLTGRPVNLVAWEDAVSVPDWLSEAVEEGVRMQCFKLLYNQGDESMFGRYQNAERVYREELKKAISFTRNFLDERSPVQSQPMIWLEE